jgi:hypothetical protein
VMEIPLRITDNRTKPNVQKPFSDSSVRCYPLGAQALVEHLQLAQTGHRLERPSMRLDAHNRVDIAAKPVY